MIYREYLVMRKALGWYAVIVLVLGVIMSLMSQHKGVTKIYLGDVAIAAGVFAAAFAWIFGVALGNGSRRAARMLWVLPAERWKLALQVIGVDFIGIAVAFTFLYLIDLTPLGTPGAKVQIVGTLSANDISLALGLAFATYGWSALVGMIGRRMPYCGIIATPALVIWLTMAESHGAISPIFRVPIIANPLAVFNRAIAVHANQTKHYALDSVTIALQWLGSGWEAPVLFAIAAATCGLAIILWQRAEVIY